MKIQIKIFAIVALLSAIALTIAGAGIWLMQGYNREVDSLQLASQRAFNGEHLNRLITAVVMDSRGIYAAADTEKAAQFADGIKKNLGDLDQLLASWAPIVTSDQKPAFDDVTAKAREFIQFRTELADLGVNQSPTAAAEKGNNEANRSNRKALQADVDKLVEADRATLDAVRAEIGNFYQKGFTLLLTIAGIGVLVGIGAAGWIGTAKISRPIGKINDALNAISQGNNAVVIPAGLGNDEIGLLWKSVGEFRDAQNEAVHLREAQADQDAQRRIEQKATMEALASRFESDIGQMIQALGGTARTTLDAAQTMATDAEETARRTVVVAGACEETSANVQAVAGASEELSSSISEIGRQISDASALISDAVEQARRTDQDVRSLAESAAKVGAIVSMIQAIAEQTNLLALNATIEAARAGEAGRGFAVVASEVKALANQTAKATQDIEAQMNTIQISTQQSVGKIADISRRIDDLNTIALSVSSATDQQNLATGEIARNIAEAAQGAAEVASTIVDVRRTAEKGGMTSRELLSAISSMNEHSGSIDQKVKAFLSYVRAA